MRRKPRGRAIIINIIDFDGTNLMPREGAQYDGINMQALFRELRFEVVLHVNLTKSVSYLPRLFAIITSRCVEILLKCNV